MSTLIATPEVDTDLPDHTQLPDKDGVPLMNSLEQPQNALLSETLLPVLRQLHPDGHFFLGRDCGIYWRPTNPPAKGCKSPDWYYVADVPPLLDGLARRSYVMWQEAVAPLAVLEFASGNGAEERDRTRQEGKFWVYEQGIRIPYYGIYVVFANQLEMYQLTNGYYVRATPNEQGRYLIEPLGVELGIWHGRYENTESDWLRWWDLQGNMLPTGEERALQAHLEAHQADARAAEADARAAEADARAAEADAKAAIATARAERLAAKMREHGLDVNGD